MMQTTTIAPGVTLRCCRDTRFKQGGFSFQLVRPMRKAEAAKNALLPAVLLRGTNRCPDLRAVTNFGVGYDNVDVAEAKRRGIVVSGRVLTRS